MPPHKVKTFWLHLLHVNLFFTLHYIFFISIFFIIYYEATTSAHNGIFLQRDVWLSGTMVSCLSEWRCTIDKWKMNIFISCFPFSFFFNNEPAMGWSRSRSIINFLWSLWYTVTRCRHSVILFTRYDAVLFGENCAVMWMKTSNTSIQTDYRHDYIRWLYLARWWWYPEPETSFPRHSP